MSLKSKDKQVKTLIPNSYLKYNDLNVDIYYLNNNVHSCYFEYNFGYVNKNISPVTNSHFACLSFLCCQLLVDYLNKEYFNNIVSYELLESKFILNFENNNPNDFIKNFNFLFKRLFEFDLSKVNIKNSINKVMIKINTLINENYISYFYSKLYNDDKIPLFNNSIKDEFYYIKEEEIKSFFSKYIYKNYNCLYIFSSINSNQINEVLEKYHFVNENNQSTYGKHLDNQSLSNADDTKLNSLLKNENIFLSIKLHNFEDYVLKYGDNIYSILLIYEYLSIKNYINCINKVKKDFVNSFSNNKLIYCYDKLFYTGTVLVKHGDINLEQINKLYIKNRTTKNEFIDYKNYLLNLFETKCNSPVFIVKVLLNVKNSINYNTLYNLIMDLDYETYKSYLDYNKDNKIYSFKKEN